MFDYKCKRIIKFCCAFAKKIKNKDFDKGFTKRKMGESFKYS